MAVREGQQRLAAPVAQALARQAGESRPGGERFQAPALAAGAQRAIDQDRLMSDLARQIVRPSIKTPIQYQTAPDTRAHGHEDHIPGAAPCAVTPLCERG